MRVDSWFDSMCFTSQFIDAQEFDTTGNVKLRDVPEAQLRDPMISRLLPFVVNGKQLKAGQLPRGMAAQ